MKTRVFFFAILALVITSVSHTLSAYSGDPQSQRSMDPNIVMDSVHGCIDSGFSIEGEFLWWRAHIDNLEFATDIDTAVNPSIGKGYYYQPKFKYDPGVRVSVGYDFGCQNWDVFFRWTYQDTNASNNRSIDPSVSVLSPLRDFFAPNGLVALTFADSAKASWKNRINVFDFEMGYDYFFSKRFSMRPYMGIKAAWIDMDYHICYTNVIATSFVIGPFSLGTVDITNESDYWGVGPQLGINGNLYIGWGFSLYGLGSAALLYGQYDTSYRQKDTGQGNDLKFFENNYFRQRAMFQFVLGAEWAKCFSERYLLSFHVGWEGQYWLNQLEFRYLNGDFKPTGDLTYTGLDVGARFDF